MNTVAKTLESFIIVLIKYIKYGVINSSIICNLPHKIIDFRLKRAHQTENLEPFTEVSFLCIILLFFRQRILRSLVCLYTKDVSDSPLNCLVWLYSSGGGEQPD